MGQNLIKQNITKRIEILNECQQYLNDYDNRLFWLQII